VNFEELLGVLDSPLLGLHSINQQLVIVGDTIFQAGQLYAERSYLLFDAFNARMATDEPPMPLDCFDRYVRQSMGVEFDRFVEPTRFFAIAEPSERGRL
jgi:hypothetical protein